MLPLNNQETEAALKLAGLKPTTQRKRWLGLLDAEELQAALLLAGNPQVTDPTEWFNSIDPTATIVKISPIPKWLTTTIQTNSNDDK